MRKIAAVLLQAE